MGKRRLRVSFTKQDGTASEFWAPQPAGWAEMGATERAEWVSRTAFRRHTGAQNATVVQET